MKKNGSLLFCLAIFWTGCDKATESIPEAQQPPKAVVQTIADQFVDVTGLEITTMLESALYAADFYAQTKHYQAVIDKDGTIRTLEEARDTADLPINGRGYINNQFSSPTNIALYAQVIPDTRVVYGYSVRITEDGKNYLLAFDTIGARISTMAVPLTDWWRYEVQFYTEIPPNIRVALETEHPQLQFQDAAMFVDVNRTVTWYTAIHHNSFLFNYQFNANGQILNSSSEDLLALDGPNIIHLDLDVMSLPTVISDFLDARFTGWGYERGIMILQNNSLVGFTVKIMLHQTDYYVRFNMTGDFIGATKG